MTVLQTGDLLISIRIPKDWAETRFYYEKVSERRSWDFSLVTVASAVAAGNGIIERVRLAVNGVAPYPMRLTEVEEKLRGQSLNEETAETAGEMAIQDAEPLRQNRYKVPLMRNLVTRAIRGAEA